MLAGARLTVLDLSDNAFGPDGVKGIEKLLRSSACFTLEELRLNNCGMGIGGGKVSQGALHLIYGPVVCRRCFMNVVTCFLTPQILAASLTQCHKNASADGKRFSLKVFVAGRNRLENEGATALAQAFQVQDK